MRPVPVEQPQFDQPRDLMMLDDAEMALQMSELADIAPAIAPKAVAAALSVLSLVAIASAVFAHRRWLTSRSEEGWRFLLIFLWAVLPVLLTVLVSLHKPVFVHRYLLVALPGIMPKSGLRRAI